MVYYRLRDLDFKKVRVAKCGDDASGLSVNLCSANEASATQPPSEIVTTSVTKRTPSAKESRHLSHLRRSGSDRNNMSKYSPDR